MTNFYEEEFLPLDEYPGYSISNMGTIHNDYREGRIVRPSINQMGILHVGLIKDGAQRHRSVAVLVAKAFLPEPENSKFDTPIHLNGDRLDCRAENLLLRPRWFAIRYHQQFKEEKGPYIPRPIEELRTGEIFENSQEAARYYGLLEKDLFVAVANDTFTPITHQFFREL